MEELEAFNKNISAGQDEIEVLLYKIYEKKSEIKKIDNDEPGPTMEEELMDIERDWHKERDERIKSGMKEQTLMRPEEKS